MFVKEESLWGNGSYEGGITEAMFVALKNVLFPEKEQVTALEKYTKKYVRRYLQNPETGEIVWWFEKYHTDRAYNYMHVANFYHAMYKIGSRYGLTSEYEPQEYLEFAYSTLVKMYKASRAMDLIVGLMGGQGIFEILGSLRDEDMIQEYYELLLKVNEHRRRLFENNVPYGSECAYDNTGYECVTHFADYYDDMWWLKKLSEITLAAKGSQPAWWWHGSDIRWWDAEYDFSECCLHYTGPFNSQALLKSISKAATEVDVDILSAVYGGILGVFSKIHQDGSGSMSYCWEQESPNYGFHAFSGDIGLGLYGALKALSAFVYYSTEKGLNAFMCEAVEHNDGRIVELCPWEVSAKKIMWNIADCENQKTDFKGELKTAAGSVSRLKLDKENKSIEVEIAHDTDICHNTDVIIKCCLGYDTKVKVNGKFVQFMKTSEDEIKIPYNVKKDIKTLKLVLKNIHIGNK